MNVSRAVVFSFHEEGSMPAGLGDVGVLNCEIGADYEDALLLR